MMHFRLDERSPAYETYLSGRTYPIIVTEGHLLNLRVLKPTEHHQPPYGTPLLECLLYASIHFHTNSTSRRCLSPGVSPESHGRNQGRKSEMRTADKIVPAYDIFWTKLYKRLDDVGKESGNYVIAASFDLLCEIQIHGGTYAKIGLKNFSWDKTLKRWVLPVLSQQTPLFLVGKEGVPIDTDGEAIYAKVGIVGNHMLRSRINRIAHNHYHMGSTWY